MARPRGPIYLDHHATTPVDPRVLEEMLPWFVRDFGNAASRTHAFGWKAEAAVRRSRETLAEALGAAPKEIVFTSGATEATSLALLGAARANRGRGDHVVTSAAEHRAVLDAGRQLEKEGFRVTVLAPDSAGRVSPESVAAALTDRTTLVSVMAANNEIGTLNPIREIAAVLRPREILFHTDAVQAFGKEEVDVNRWGVDLASVTAHKLYGPKGIGALFVRSVNPRVRLEPILFGGGHEDGLRSGTLNVPGVVGFAAAVRLALATRAEEQARLRALRDRLEAGLRALPGVRVNGHPVERLAANLNVAFEGVEGGALLTGLREIAVSSGSACSSATAEPSHVLKAIGLPDPLARASIRFGLGRFTTAAEIDVAIAAVTRAVTALRANAPVAAART